LSSGALPGALPFTRPGGPSALKANTQSRTDPRFSAAGIRKRYKKIAGHHPRQLALQSRLSIL
jgi:hypothetical protein